MMEAEPQEKYSRISSVGRIADLYSACQGFESSMRLQKRNIGGIMFTIFGPPFDGILAGVVIAVVVLTVHEIYLKITKRN